MAAAGASREPNVESLRASSDELREGYLSFFESKGHLRRPSGSLVPPTHDPSVLLTTAGMQPLKPYFLGLEEPPARRLTSAQKCFRATDIDSVGLTARHLTFFEMLGNFSIGDYFKDGAIDLAWEFTTERLEFPVERVWATVFAGDPELGLGRDEVAVAGWERVGIPAERIVDLPRAENFWQAGPTGPCGPCSELYYDRGAEHGCGRAGCAPGCDCDRFLEFWNLVFMELDLHEDGSLTPLPSQNIDTGLGIERGAALLQGVHSVYETDGFQAIMDWVAAQTGTRYGESETATKAHRVLADHGRAMTFLVADGVVPSNEGRGYILRRVVRRAIQHGSRIGLEAPFLSRLADVVVERMGTVYPELGESRGEIHQVLTAEEERFAQTLERGTRLFEEVVIKAPSAGAAAIAGADVFVLHDTYGFPVELTRELAEERGLAIDIDGFNRLMAAQRVRSRSGARGGGDLERAADFVRAAGFATTFVGYERTEVLTADRGAREPRRRDRPREAPRVPVLRGRGRSGQRPGMGRDRRRGAGASCHRLSIRRGPGASPRGGSGSQLVTACTPWSPGGRASRRWRITRGRTCCTGRCRRCSATTSGRRARRCGRTSFASTSRTAPL